MEEFSNLIQFEYPGGKRNALKNGKKDAETKNKTVLDSKSTVNGGYEVTELVQENTQNKSDVTEILQ